MSRVVKAAAYLTSNQIINLLIFFAILDLVILLLILILFFSRIKTQKWEIDSALSFECGFSSNFSSRFSFSMHFFMVGLIFLFLDLELCFVIPLINEDLARIKIILLFWLFILVLLLRVLKEWKEGEIEWKF